MIEKEAKIQKSTQVQIKNKKTQLSNQKRKALLFQALTNSSVEKKLQRL